MISCVTILGSTGSIGRQTLDIVEHLNIPVAALTAGTSVDRMAQQCRKFRPKLAVMATEEAANALREALSDLDMEFAWGEEGLIRAAQMEQADCVITAVVGMLGLKPTMAAIRAGKRIGLANKETLVCAGELVMAEAKKYNARIIPVDSEHSAIFQCLMGCNDSREIKKLILTASGGPFFGKKTKDLQGLTVDDALAHPTWSMGAKITVDSATLMNKGFEVIEAAHLFGVDADRIEVVVHRESIIHSMVEYIDNSIIAQMSVPDMRLCVQYALTAPHRTLAVIPPLDLVSIGKLSFFEPDLKTFPLLGAARDALRVGGGAPAALNAANEIAVGAFLERRISLLQIFDTVLGVMADMPHAASAHTLSEILDADREARERALGKLSEGAFK